MADPVEMKLLHMLTADPARTPTFTWFAQPDYFLFAGAPNCTAPCVQEQFGFAWNHGDVTPDITTTWLGMVGPGVKNQGLNDNLWSDHTDIRPTMLSLLGLTDDYTSDGRVLTEPLYSWALPQTLRAHHETLERLGAIYKQLNAPVGQFGLDTLAASTNALTSGSTSSDTTYTTIENQIASLTNQRDALAAQIQDALNAAEFGGQAINEQQAKTWINQAQQLIHQAHALAG